MARFIKSLLGYDRNVASPEETEAYRVANEALQYRVNMIARQSNRASSSDRPTTDIYGRSII
jgi:hypothetical protein